MVRVDKLLCWNMGGAGNSKAKPSPSTPDKPSPSTPAMRLALLSDMIREHEPSLVALQEAPPEADLKICLGSAYSVTRTSGAVASAYRNQFWSCIDTDIADKRVAIAQLDGTAVNTKLWLVNAHGPALHVDTYARARWVRDLHSKLKALRRKEERSEIVAGDMNVPPFDEAIRRDLLANRCLPWVKSAVRSSGENRALFNATWELLGRRDISGTFYQSDVQSDGPWCAIDQVLLSPNLVGIHPMLDIIESVCSTPEKKLLRTSGPIGAPNLAVGSDHLPLLARFTVS